MANLVELFDNIVQMQNLNGVPLAAGKLYVYALGRTRLMDTWSDVDGESLNPNPIILDDAGQAHVYVSDDFDYTLVVCDQYNNEIFSLDKYLYSKGSHSHADVAVAPSESIAVSSYHVGECTVYVPYLTGQLGKVYEGIDPIVVNNQVDKISANHVPLGVQDPLYFVQDDEEGCIIGCSAQTEIPAELSGKWDNASDVVIANSAQWSEGTTYEAGSYIDIDNNTISVTGLSPLPADTASTGLVAQVSADITAMIPDTSDMATQTWVNEQGFLTAHQDISNKLDTTAFSTVSGDFLTAIPSEYVTENTLQSGLSSKLDSTAFSTVSSTFLTAHQSLDGLMSASLLEQSGGLITGYNGTAFAGQGGGVTGDFELSAGSGISIVDYPLEQKTVISVTAQGGNPEVEQAVIDNSATWNTVSDKLDTTAFSDVSGSFLTTIPNTYLQNTDLSTADGKITAISGIPLSAGGNVAVYTDAALPNSTQLDADIAAGKAICIVYDGRNYWFDRKSSDYYFYGADAYSTYLYYLSFRPENNSWTRGQKVLATQSWVTAQGYLTGVDLTPYQTTADMVNYQPVSSMTAYQSAGDYATTAQLADKLDSSAIGIKTGPVDLVSSINGLKISAWTADNASYASRASLAYADNQGNYFSSTYIKNTDLATADGKVTAISGIPLSAGGDVPEGVMVESGIEYNSQGYINGYSGSAIATIDQERQWFTHDDTLCHVSNSAQYALGINMSAISADLARMMGVDETVLYSGDYNGTTTSYALNDNISSFEKIKVYGMTNDSDMLFTEFYTSPQPRYFSFFGTWSGIQLKTRCYVISNNTAFNNFGGVEVNFGSTTTGTHQHIGITKVIGIGRRQ